MLAYETTGQPHLAKQSITDMVCNKNKKNFYRNYRDILI
jgi:hypothetical protein